MHVEDSNGQVTKGCCDSTDSEHPKDCIWETVEKGTGRTMLNSNIIPVDFAVGGLTPVAVSYTHLTLPTTPYV